MQFRLSAISDELQVPLAPPAPTQYPGIPPGLQPGVYGAPMSDMSSLNSGVRNMTVDENGGFIRHPQMAPPLPPGVLPPQYAQQQYAAQYGAPASNPHLLRSNSYQ